jgi:hypothetical protein
MFIDCKNHSTALFLIGILFSLPAYAVKTDIVVLLNGDAVTGEIKALDFGALRYSTDSMGTVGIDWEDIVSITSNQLLEVELTDGTKYYGQLLAPEHESTVRVKTASQEVSLPAEQIVRITPIETSDKFWQRLDGSFSFGYQTQKASDVATSNLAADVSYRTRKYLLGLNLSSAITEQSAEPASARQSIEANYQRFKGNRWFTDWFSRAEKNDELGINGRWSIGGALGRYFVNTNRNQFSVTAGLQSASTSYTGEDENTTDAEGRFEFRYLHRSLVPESSLTFSSKVYPLIEDLSQFRAETDLIFRREFVNDLFWDVTIGHSYVSDPPENGSNSDHTVTTSIGYKF